jgi:hypothetical protein
VERFGLRDLGFQLRVPSEDLSAEVFLDDLEAEKDQLFQEVDNKALPHLLSQGCRLRLSLWSCL